MGASKKAVSVSNVQAAKFHILDFAGEWYAAVGAPERSGTHIIIGPPKNGKTSFEMMYAKYLCTFERTALDSIEEGLSLTIQMAMQRVHMEEAGTRLVLYDKVEIDELREKLDARKSPNIVFIDSVQFADMTFKQYKELKKRYPNKLFVYVSHVDGNKPEGSCAKRIYKDAAVIWRIEGFRAFPTSRFQTHDVPGTPIDIWKEEADKYWSAQNQTNLTGSPQARGRSGVS